MEFVPAVMNRSNKMSKRKKRSVNSLLKVVYISSPMKVKTSASRFRTLVQELTGRDSDISRFMDMGDGDYSSTTHLHQDFEILPDHHQKITKRGSSSKSTADNQDDDDEDDRRQHRVITSSSSPTSSESIVEQEEQPPTFDDAFINEHYFQGLLSSDLFSDSSELDVLGSYDAL